MARKPQNIGWQSKRIKSCERERAFAETWQEECEPIAWINQGCGLAQNLFMRTVAGSIYTYIPVVILTGRERMIAATIIQWLGTNCGMVFLDECLSKFGYRIEKIKPDNTTTDKG
jgi:hypothetical protein